MAPKTDIRIIRPAQFWAAASVFGFLSHSGAGIPTSASHSERADPASFGRVRAKAMIKPANPIATLKIVKNICGPDIAQI